METLQKQKQKINQEKSERGKEAHRKAAIGFSEGWLSRLGQTYGRARRQSRRPLWPSTAVIYTCYREIVSILCSYRERRREENIKKN